MFRVLGFGASRFCLEASWVISGVISRVTMVITHIRGLLTPLVTTHEAPSKGFLQGSTGALEGFKGC